VPRCRLWVSPFRPNSFFGQRYFLYIIPDKVSFKKLRTSIYLTMIDKIIGMTMMDKFICITN
jgi:hypothetical protein